MNKKHGAQSKPYILIAEDDHYYANIYRVKLTKEGYDVEIVSDGDWALEAAKARMPSLILLDMRMPKKDGYEVLKELQADALLSTVPVLILSNLGSEDDRAKAIALGAQDYLVKASNSIHTIVETIKQYVK